MQWPKFFPKHCPPEDANQANGTVYRLIQQSAPKESDFKSYWEIGRDKSTCISCGLSVYTDPDDILRLHRRIPATRTKKIAKATLTPEQGKMKNTVGHEKSHHTWWLPVGVQPWLAFQVAEIKDN